jgi:hypothetical protein
MEKATNVRIARRRHFLFLAQTKRKEETKLILRVAISDIWDLPFFTNSSISSTFPYKLIKFFVIIIFDRLVVDCFLLHHKNIF